MNIQYIYEDNIESVFCTSCGNFVVEKNASLIYDETICEMVWICDGCFQDEEIEDEIS